jgi:hypothetical protein
MPDDNCKDYTGVTREAIDKWREESAQKGEPLPPGDSFTIEKSGVKVSVEYNESILTLKICIVEKPALIPEAMVWAIVDGAVKRG